MKNIFLVPSMFAVLLFYGCKDSSIYQDQQSPASTSSSTRAVTSDFIHPNENNVFDLNALPVVTLEIPVDHWNELLEAYDESPDINHWVQGDFSYLKDGELQELPDVGIRLRGNSSRNRPEGEYGEPHDPDNPVWHQASFSVNFAKYDKTQNLEGLKKVRIKYIREDPTRVREVYSFNLGKQYGLWTTPLVSYCRFYIQVAGDTEQAYFGVYKLMENLDEEYIDNRAELFGNNNKGGFLWKGDNGANLKVADRNLMGESTPEDPKIYDLKTNAKKLTEAQDQLIDFITNLNTKEGDDFKEWVDSIMDVELFLKTYAVNVICGNVDDYWANGNNYSFYFNAEGKFFFIPNDFDTTLGTAWDIVEDCGTQDIFNWGGDNPLVRKIISVPEFKDIYEAAFHELAAGPFSVNNSIPRIQGWHSLIEDYLEDDTDDQTPFEDTPAWWSNQQRYRLLERGANNYFEVRTATLP